MNSLIAGCSIRRGVPKLRDVPSADSHSTAATANCSVGVGTRQGRGAGLSVSNSLSGHHWELDQGPAVGDRTDSVQLGTGHHGSVGDGQRRVALQRRVAASFVGGGQTPGATQQCLNPGCSESIGTSRRTGGVALAPSSRCADCGFRPRRYRQSIKLAHAHGHVRGDCLIGMALLHESSLARTMPTDRILTGRCDMTLVGRGRSSDSRSHSRGRPHSPAHLDSGPEDHLR